MEMTTGSLRERALAVYEMTEQQRVAEAAEREHERRARELEFVREELFTRLGIEIDHTEAYYDDAGLGRGVAVVDGYRFERDKDFVTGEWCLRVYDTRCGCWVSQRLVDWAELGREIARHEHLCDRVREA